MRWSITSVLFFTFISLGISTEVDDSEPFLHIMARSTVYNAGETKAIFCKGKNLVQPIQWFSPTGKQIEERSTKNTRVYLERKIEGEGVLVPLIIHHIKISDGGNWTCKSGDLSETIEFLVGEKVNIRERNVSIEGEEGKSITMTCEANGYPVPVVVWYKDDYGRIPNDPKKYVIRPDNSLEIKKLNHADVGQYVCKVRQKALSYYTDKTVQLTVQHKPLIYNTMTKTLYPTTEKYKTEEIYAIMGETKNITCSAIANPPPVYKWFRRHDNYDDGPITDEETVMTSEDDTYSVFVLRMRDESALGEYKCSAKNSKGQESIIFHVTLGEKPHPPTYVSLHFANSTDLAFNVTCSTCIMTSEEGIAPNPANLTVIGYSFQLVPVDEEYPADWDKASNFEVDIVNANDTIFVVGPLQNNTKFHGRVRTRNAAGYSEWLDIIPEPSTTDAANKLITASFIIIITAFIFTHIL